MDQTLRMDLDERSSLLRRLRAVHALYEVACATMTLDQVNAVVVPGVLPIAFSLVHQVLIEDGTVLSVGGPPPQFASTSRGESVWASRTQVKARTSRK